MKQGTPNPGSRGFALIITISMMVLLSLLAVGLLGLSTITLRGSSGNQSQQEARANARMALVLALGELQRTVGQDRFVTAPAGIIEATEGSPKHYTGVWEARTSPREESSEDGLGQSPDYDSSKAFVRWLVSDADDAGTKKESFFKAGGVKDPVEIVSAGSVGSSSGDRVFAGRVPVTGDNGRSRGEYAWWVSENATKALVRIEDESMREGQNRAQALLAAGTAGPYGLRTISDLGIEPNSAESDKLLSLGQTQLLASAGARSDSAVQQRHFHDLTADASSLLTNVTTGGLRKDLSLFFDGDPSGGSWTGSIKEGNAPLGPYGRDALSPHDEYDTGSWKALRQHYALHRTRKSDKSGLVGGSMGEQIRAVDDANPSGGYSHPFPGWNYQRKLLTPVVARLSYVLSVGVQDASKGRVSKDKLALIRPQPKPYDPLNNKYLVTFHAYPVVSLWNPYSLAMDCPGFSVGNMGMSVEHKVAIGNYSHDYQWIDHNYRNNSAQWNVIGMTVDRDFTLAPGEVKMFFGTGEVYRDKSQFYSRGKIARSLADIQFDSSPKGRVFSAGIVKNGVIGDTFNAGDSNFPGHELLIGMFGSEADTIYIDTNIFTPQGSKSSGPRADYDGLLYYGTYSSLDVRMVTRSFGSGNSWRTPALWWTQWGGGQQRSKSSKWSNKIGWRNDDANPVVIKKPIPAAVNIADLVTGREQPYMVVDLRLKATEADQDQRNPNITWLHNIPGHGYAGCTGEGTSGVSVRDAGNLVTASHARPYTVVYEPVQSGNEAWNFLQLDSVNNELRPFMGNSYWPGGQHKAVAMEVPLVPLQSIAQLQHVPQVPIDATRWSGLSLQNYAIGNSYPNPNVESDKIVGEGWNVWLDTRLDNADQRTNMDPDLDGKKWHTTVNGGGSATEHFKPTKHLDRSYAANTLLWDDFFFSGLSEQSGDFYGRIGGKKRKARQVVEGFVEGELELPNSRYRPNLGSNTSDDVIDELTDDDSYRKAAAYIDVVGGFNVNSVSKTAWKTFLASNLGRQQVMLDERGRPRTDGEESTLEEYIVSRFSLANGEGQKSGGTSSDRWLGYRVLNEDELDDLAEKIVEEVKERGPFRSIAEFVNRRLESGGSDASLRGALQEALDRSSVNEALAGDTISASEITGTDYAFEGAAMLSRHAGTPEFVMQGDLLQSIGSLIQVRSDTFTIRAYGESADGRSRAWCEAVVQRKANWVNQEDKPEDEFSDLENDNKAFGRRFEQVSFRWLSPFEI